MKRRLVSAVAVLMLLAAVVPASALAGGGHHNVLKPGQTVTFEQKVPINIVFIGYKRSSIDKSDLLGQLPDTYSPVVRYPQFYGEPGRDMGLQYNFDYNVTFKDWSFSTRFFNYLQKIGTPGEPTVFQTDYNDQVSNVLDVTGPVLYIDAPSVEGWLDKNLHTAKKGYTIVFVNWYSRPDFKFHVYTKTDEPDPDTGYNFGELRASRKVIAWGGGDSHLWFYDLSAGPEAWTNNWNVDDLDVDGDGSTDKRMPPIWEYSPGGYADPSTLSTDLGLVTRFVGIDLLFTTSPLYDPLVTAPDVGGRKVVHVNMFQDDPDSDGMDWIHRRAINNAFARFEPYYDWRTRIVDQGPIDSGAKKALDIFAGLDTSDDCWNVFGDPFAQLFCYFDANLSSYVPNYRKADYVAPIFAFNTTAANLNDQFGLLGFADDNWIDGTQSYVFEFDAAEYRDLGYGFTTTTIHEGGHHFGMSHPHDGYDSELGIDFDASGAFQFAWSGDESDTIMSYTDLSGGFSEFDEANMYRWEMAGYLNWANGLLDDVLADPHAWKVWRKLAAAEQYARKALDGFKDWNYLSAATNARRAYAQVALAADQLGIETPTDSALRMAAKAAAQRPDADPIRFPNN
jgi:hypothetical protein